MVSEVNSVLTIDGDLALSKAAMAIEESIEMCLDEAETIIGEYWVWVERSNKALKEAKLGAGSTGDVDGVGKKAYAYTGPRIENLQSGSGSQKVNKPRIIWSYYKKDGIRVKAGTLKNKSVRCSQMGQRVRMTSNKEYKLSTLARFSVGWDAQRMVETEIKLMPIREKLEALTKARVELRKIVRRINRITDSYNEVNNG